MAVGDLEAELKGKAERRQATAWASIWWDLRTAWQILHNRSQISIGAYEDAFTRRAMIDGAIVAYGRGFVGGSRSEVADVLPLVDEMGAESQHIHQEAMRWRHRHVAHRVDADWEQSDARLVWPSFGQFQPTFRIRVVTKLGPDEEFAARMAAHTKALADRVWERRLVPQGRVLRQHRPSTPSAGSATSCRSLHASAAARGNHRR